ncbi:MAG: hypothetical protein IKD04_04655 [Clostridia bacterium]|nr:hypothetical protein [Clostridia bacterium]
MEHWNKKIDKYNKKIDKYNKKIDKYKKTVEVLEKTKEYASITAENKPKDKVTLKVYNKYYRLMSDIPVWSGILFLKEKYQKALSEFRGHTLYYLYHIRYINKYKDVLLKNIEKDGQKKLEEIKNNSMSIDKLVKRINDYSTEKYDSFKKTEDRRLKKMLYILTGKEDIFTCLRADNKSFEFNRLDFSFFIFLLDTYDSLNAEYLRKGNYERISINYLIKCRKGVELLLKYHQSSINIDEIEKRFDVTFKMYDMYSSERLLQRLELLKDSVKLNQSLVKDIDIDEDIDIDKANYEEKSKILFLNNTKRFFKEANSFMSNIIYEMDKNMEIIE